MSFRTKHSLLISVVIAGFFFFLASPVSAVPPKGFVSERLTDVPFLATDVEFSPDGRLFALDQRGNVWIVENGTLSSTPFLTLKVSSDRERGLLGIAFHPDFASNRTFYLFYTTGPGSKAYSGSPKNRLSKFTVNIRNPNMVEEGSEKILLDNIASDAGMHNAGALKIGPDGKLYIATGDGGRTSANSQNLGNLNGKILRLNLDGSIPSDNPFVGQNGKRGEIWAYGLRNPWRFAFHPVTGDMFIADVGAGKQEEIDIGHPGANYGWPQTEGTAPKGVAGVMYPVYAYGRTSSGASIIGGEVYAGSQFPADYAGNYFFADFVQYFIKRLRFDRATGAVKVDTFDTNVGGVVDLAFGPDGAIYISVADGVTSGHIQKISYRGGETPTTDLKAAITASAAYGASPFKVTFSGTGSHDPHGEGLRYRWNFGDGTKGKGMSVQHTFTKRGTYRVTLSVTDASGSQAEASTVVSADNRPPKITMVDLEHDHHYQAGDTIRYRAKATDAEDGSLPSSAFAWEITFHHAEEDEHEDDHDDGHADHAHPFLAGLSGKRGAFVVPTDGEASVNTWYELKLTVTDRDGLSSTTTRRIEPHTTTVSVRANVTGVTLSLDGAPSDLPLRFSNVVNFPRSLSVPESVTFEGKTYVFDAWSDGGNREHVIRPGTDPVVYEARYIAVDDFPIVMLNEAPSGESTSTTARFSWSGKDDSDAPSLLRFRARMDGGDWSDSGTVTHMEWQHLSRGSHTVELQAVDSAGDEGAILQKIFAVVADQGLAVGVRAGSGSSLRLFRTSSELHQEFFPYEAQFRGGVNVLGADVNGDGERELVVAPEGGRAPEVRLYSARGERMASFVAYGKTFKGGVNLAAGDFDGDGTLELVTAPNGRGGPHVRFWTQRGASFIPGGADLFPYDTAFHGGVSIAAADLDGDGDDELITAPFAQGGPDVRIFSLVGGSFVPTIPRFQAFAAEFRGGVVVTAGDLEGDGRDELFLSPQSKARGILRVFGLRNGRMAPLEPQRLLDPETKDGMGVVALDANADGVSELAFSPRRPTRIVQRAERVAAGGWLRSGAVTVFPLLLPRGAALARW